MLFAATLQAEIGQIRNNYEFLTEGRRESLQKEKLLTLTGNREDRAVNFIFNLMTKMLGRLTQRTLVDAERRYVTDGWITWGYDYVNDNLFKAFNSVGLDTKYPALRMT